MDPIFDGSNIFELFNLTIFFALKYQSNQSIRMKTEIMQFVENMLNFCRFIFLNALIRWNFSNFKKALKYQYQLEENLSCDMSELSLLILRKKCPIFVSSLSFCFALIDINPSSWNIISTPFLRGKTPQINEFKNELSHQKLGPF